MACRLKDLAMWITLSLRKAFFSFLLLTSIVACQPKSQPAQTAVYPSPQKIQETVTTMPVIQPSPTVKPILKNTPTQKETLQGIGVIGDSFYDEYRGSDHRGNDYAQVTFNEIELLVKLRKLDFGTWGDWGEPRRTGYEYNWARSGATSQTMIDQGQPTGLAEQIRSGKVNFVLIGIGANDFSPYYLTGYSDIYSGKLNDQEVQAKVQKAVENVTLAVDTVQKAGAKHVALTMFTQWDLDPQLVEKYPDDKGRKRVAQAIDAVNQGIRTMADQKNVFLIDQNHFSLTLVLPKLVDHRYLNFSGERIDFLTNGDEPHHSRLGDGQHVGTVMSGLVANYYFIDIINKAFGMQIPFLSDEEILTAAGLR
jgi:hypothetical protein